MKIFYGGLQYDHYDPSRGLSFEHNNFYLSLLEYPGAEVTYFPFERILTLGREKFNAELLDAVKKEKPDIVFFFMYSDELDRRTLTEMKHYTKTVAWFADDSWRFYNYSRMWAPHFTWAITTYSWMPDLYRRAGQPNVIRSQWAANAKIYKPVKSSSSAPDVSFVGGATPARRRIVSTLQRAGIQVGTFGAGWDGGRVSDEAMVTIFSNSKINLGLNPPPGRFTRNSIGRLLLKPSLGHFVPSFDIAGNAQTFLKQTVPQIKARHFEIPACGGFLLTAPADDIENFYVPDKEIVLYRSDSELIEKVRYYLAHGDERTAIARAGYERTMREHTYEKRFAEIFRRVLS